MHRRDQGLAAKAWTVVRDAKTRGASDEFRTRVMGLPAMLQSGGLIATMTFLRGRQRRGEDALQQAYGRVFDALAEHVAPGRPEGALAWLTQCGPSDYRRATIAARDLALWLRRAAEAELAEVAGAATGEGGDAADA